mgnify:CR=1 FL=1
MNDVVIGIILGVATLLIIGLVVAACMITARQLRRETKEALGDVLDILEKEGWGKREAPKQN